MRVFDDMVGFLDKLKDALKLMVISMRFLEKDDFELVEELVEVLEFGLRSGSFSVAKGLGVPRKNRDAGRR